MRRVVVVLLAAAACRPKPPEPLARQPEVEPDEPVGDLPKPPEIELAPRPDIDVSNLVPDPTHELRWPLSMASHPELEPQFEIAASYVEIGKLDDAYEINELALAADDHRNVASMTDRAAGSRWRTTRDRDGSWRKPSIERPVRGTQ